MSPPPARGWTHLQALLLAEVRAFSARQQLRTVDTRVSTLMGERFVDAAWRQKAAAPQEPEQAEVSTSSRSQSGFAALSCLRVAACALSANKAVNRVTLTLHGVRWTPFRQSHSRVR